MISLSEFYERYLKRKIKPIPKPWMACLKAVNGEALDSEELAIFQKHTGRQKPPRKPVKRFWGDMGRRSLKTYMACLEACRRAVFFDYRGFLSPGERAVVLLLAKDRQQVKVAFRFIQGIFHLKPFKKMIVAERSDSIDLSNGITVEVATCNYGSIRGRLVVCAILDELAFWQAEDSSNPASEVITALEPSMATIKNGLSMMISTPYSASGPLWDAFQAFWGKDDSEDDLVWVAATYEMNPEVSEAFVRKELARDPIAGPAEWLGQFRKDISRAYANEVLQACVVPGRYELPFTGQFVHGAFVDMSGGMNDASAIAIGHREEKVVVLDVLRVRRPPFDTAVIVREFCELVRAYKLDRVTGDRYGASWVAQEFIRNGVSYQPSAKTASDIFVEFEPLLNTRRVLLLDNTQLLNELRGLERRTSRMGKDVVSHTMKGHDDLAVACAGCVVLLNESPDFSGVQMKVHLGVSATVGGGFGTSLINAREAESFLNGGQPVPPWWRP